MLEALVHAVGNGAIVVERGEDFLHLVQHIFDADHVEEGFLLAGERCVRQIFGGGGGAHGHGDVLGAGILAELDIGIADGLVELSRQRGLGDPFADLLAGRGQGLHVIDIKRRQACLDALGHAAFVEVLLKRIGGGGKATRHGHTEFGEVADHLAERRILAANLAQVGHAQRVEPKHQVVQGSLLKSSCVDKGSGTSGQIPKIGYKELVLSAVDGAEHKKTITAKTHASCIPVRLESSKDRLSALR